MSCDLLEKLAPETRTLIYEYVLTFNTPLKHVHKMRPFVEKSGQNTESAESNKSKTETSSSEEPSAANDSFNRVNTSLLTTCKLIYKEAIAVFYKLNKITFDTAICKPRNLLALYTSDLSLVTQVTVESVMKIDPANGRTDGLGEVATFSAEGFWLVFPKLKAVTVYVYTDAHPLAVSALFAITAKLSSTTGFEGVKFDGVGSAVAHPNWPTLPTQHTKFTLVVQCRKTVDRWANAREAYNADDVMSISMRLVHYIWKEDNAPGTIDPITSSPERTISSFPSTTQSLNMIASSTGLSPTRACVRCSSPSSVSNLQELLRSRLQSRTHPPILTLTLTTRRLQRKTTKATGKTGTRTRTSPLE
jgi:hypothetical protein